MPTGMGINILNRIIDLIQNYTKFRMIYGYINFCFIEYEKYKRIF